jgi:hypothetical protein
MLKFHGQQVYMTLTKNIMAAKLLLDRRTSLPHKDNVHIFYPKTYYDIEYMSIVPYFSIICSIMYAMAYSHHDLSHAFNVVSRFMDNIGEKH